MKNNKKGFMLVETLVVTTLISTVLVALYLQFNTLVRNFNKSFYYNSVDDLYSAYNLKKIFTSDSIYSTLKSGLESQNYYEILPSCSQEIANGTYNGYKASLNNCDKFGILTNFYGVERIIYTKEEIVLTDSDYNSIQSSFLDPNFVDYIKNISQKTYNGFYRLIIKYDNREYATVIIAD